SLAIQCGTIKNHVFYYRRYAPKELTHRRNSTIVKLMTMPFLFF
ncbi:hypothetical protein SMU86_02785, partial [Streptococcus mutans U2A]